MQFEPKFAHNLGLKYIEVFKSLLQMYISSSLNTVKTGSKNHDENNFASLFLMRKEKVIQKLVQ